MVLLFCTDMPPSCIAIIMDGNRRWATARGLPKLEGHRAGLNKIEEVARWTGEAGIKHLVLYALSTENLRRAEDEVGYFMDLSIEAAQTKLHKLGEENVRVRIAGKLELLPETVQRAMHKVQEETAGNTGLTVWICFAYGGRAEIIEAARRAAQEDITEESLKKNLWTAGMPEPDLIIRPGGEKRLSNFLLWQSAYSELFFLDVMWPDFSKEDLDKVLAEFAVRERRRGI
jgi:undecaprenyl diphosphate synthase